MKSELYCRLEVNLSKATIKHFCFRNTTSGKTKAKMLKGRRRGSIKNLIYRNWTLFYINILGHWLKCISSNIFGIQIKIKLVTELLSSVLRRFFCCTSLFVIFLRVLMSGDPKHFLITLIFLNFESIATMDN